MATVVLAGTFDTKGGEYAFARDKILSQGLVKKVLMVDIGVRSTPDTEPRADINAAQVVAAAGGNYEELKTMTEAEAFVILTKGLVATLLDLHKKGSLHGVMGMGGGCGSALLSPAFQQLPLGVPKLLVSTVIACGPARPYISGTDMTLIYAVTDLGGHVTSVNRQIVSNAATGIGAMAADYAANESQHFVPEQFSTPSGIHKPLIVASMMGYTQRGALAAEKRLNQYGYEVVIFHTVGAGGEAMEKLIATGAVAGVLDITLMEVMHSTLPHSVIDAGPDRLETAGRLGVPQVIVPGAVELFTFGPRKNVPPKYKDRAFNPRNVNFGALRASQEECTCVGELIASKLNRSKGPVTLFIPNGGVSSASVPGMVLYDKAADECLFAALRANLDRNVVRLVEREEHINDVNFAEAAADALHEYVKHKLDNNQH